MHTSLIVQGTSRGGVLGKGPGKAGGGAVCSPQGDSWQYTAGCRTPDAVLAALLQGSSSPTPHQHPLTVAARVAPTLASQPCQTAPDLEQPRGCQSYPPELAWGC